MVNKTISWLFIGIFVLLAITACDNQEDSLMVSEAQAQVTGIEEAAVVDTAAAEQAADTSAATSPTAALSSVVLDTAAVQAASSESASNVSQGSGEAEVWAIAAESAEESSDVTEILLAGDAIKVTGKGVTVDGHTATITTAGTYRLSGTLAGGQVVVDTEDENKVQLILDGVQISNETTAPIFIANAEEAEIVLAEGSENYVADGAAYVFPEAEEDEPNAAIFSKDDLTIYGAGALTVVASYNDGIASKDDLIIAGGTITVQAVDDGIRGKESLLIVDGTIAVTAGGDGLKADEDEDAEKGTITIEGGDITINSGGDAVQAQTELLITDGRFDLTTGGGSSQMISDDTSAKGLKAGVLVTIDGGSFSINAADDGVHANDTIVVNGGIFDIASGDDGFHADANLEFNGGTVAIVDSYEGLESAVITINDGDFNIVASDDGINVVGGNDGSGFGPGGGPGGGRPPGRGGFNGGPGQDTFVEYTGDYYLYINGGTIVVDAGGDGLDINGAIEMTDGVLLVNGPTEQMNGAIDYDGSFTMSGGFVVAAGSAGMAQTADASSTQNVLLMNFNGTLAAGTLIHIEDSGGNSVLTFAPTKAYQSIALSSPALSDGMTYTVYYGGTASGTEWNGLYVDGTYSPGTELTTFTVAGTVTRLGSGGMR